MILIIGGYAQGKTQYAVESCGASPENIIYLNKRVKKCFDEGQSTVAWLDEINENDSEYILIADEIGNGIVPLDPYERKLREITGRAQTEAAKRSREVIRVICGIGQRIK